MKSSKLSLLCLRVFNSSNPSAVTRMLALLPGGNTKIRCVGPVSRLSIDISSPTCTPWEWVFESDCTGGIDGDVEYDGEGTGE